MMPAVFMAIAGMLLGASAGPGLGLAGSIGSVADSSADLSEASALLELLEAAAKSGNECPYEDQSSGWGGQSGSCVFECPGPAGTFRVHVQADDKDATVSGTASCGQYDQHCDGDKSCTADGSYDGTQLGSCSGDSDETYDSGIYINCSANGEDVGTGDPGPGTTEKCILTKPLKVCYHAGAVPPATKPLFGLCARLQCSIEDSQLRVYSTDGVDGAHLYAAGGYAVGALCDQDGACELIQPKLTFGDGRWNITI